MYVLAKYLDKNNSKIDLIVPVLRGGGIPALRLAFMFKVVRILPFQYKYLHVGTNSHLKKVYDSNFNNLINFKSKAPVILVVEGNHSTGNVANKVVSEIKQMMPDSKIIYVALAKDYNYRDSVKNVDFTSCGIYTNENKKLSKEECDNLDVPYDKLFLFPWESVGEELASLNQTDFDYNLASDFKL